MNELKMRKLAIIPGTGASALRNLIVGSETVDTYFGRVKVDFILNAKGEECIIVNKHNEDEGGHALLPSEINFRAIFLALKMLGVTQVVSISMAGTLQSYYSEAIVIPTDIINFGSEKNNTFFGQDGIGKIYYVDISNPFCALHTKYVSWLEGLSNEGFKIVQRHGAHERSERPLMHVRTTGPHFETPATIEFYRKAIGASTISMSLYPEVALARELNFCYSAVIVIANLAAGLQKTVTQEEVYRVASEKMLRVINTIMNAEYEEHEHPTHEGERLLLEFISSQENVQSQGVANIRKLGG